MSFASDVKNEVARLEVDENGKKAELCAIIKLLSTMSLSSHGLALTVRSKNANVIRMVSEYVNDIYGIKPGLGAIKDNRFDKKNIYAVVIEDKVREILKDLDLWTDNGIQEHPRMKFLNNDNMIRAYLSGCFLATGSVNHPSKTNYHMEVVVNEESHAEFIVRLLAKFYINARIATRRSQYVVYVKASEQISDFLRLMGASNAIFTFEDVRIQRDFVNNLSRLNNCELANDAKSLQTAHKQYEAVEFLLQKGHMEKLSEKDQEMAMLRFENPDASLLELSELYEDRTGTVLSKSGIRHRFNKIMELAEKYRNRG